MNSLRTSSVVFALATFSGCGTAPCTDGPAPPVLAACAVPEAGWTTGSPSGEGVDVSFVGTVTEVGDGIPPLGCFDELHPGGDAPEAASWARITESGTGDVWVVGFVAPDATSSVFPGSGEAIAIDYSFQFGGFGPDRGGLTVRDGMDGLLVWVGADGGVDSIVTPAELSLSKGQARCLERDSCGDWQEYHLDIAVNGQPQDDGLTVEYGTSTPIEGFDFHHGGYAETTRYSNSCADWFVADLDAALVVQVDAAAR